MCIQNVTMARFARNVVLDFFCDFQTLCIKAKAYVSFLCTDPDFFCKLHLFLWNDNSKKKTRCLRSYDLVFEIKVANCNAHTIGHNVFAGIIIRTSFTLLSMQKGSTGHEENDEVMPNGSATLSLLKVGGHSPPL